VKKLLEIVVSLLLHPVAFVLALLNILARRDLSSTAKLVWGVVSFVWGVGPILYVLVGDGELW
jgi:hypothetical protein